MEEQLIRNFNEEFIGWQDPTKLTKSAQVLTKQDDPDLQAAQETHPDKLITAKKDFDAQAKESKVSDCQNAEGETGRGPGSSTGPLQSQPTTEPARVAPASRFPENKASEDRVPEDKVLEDKVPEAEAEENSVKKKV